LFVVVAVTKTLSNI